MACSFELFSHLVIKNEVSFLDQDIQNLTELLFTYDQLSLLLFVFVVLDDKRLFLRFFFFRRVEGDPVESQLLIVDDLITLDDLFFELLHLKLIHCLNLIVSLKIRFLEVLELPLQLFELSCDSLVIRCELLVGILEFLVFFLILRSKISVSCVEDAFFFLELFVILVIFFLLFLQNFQVVVELFSVQLIQSLHFLITFFKVLNIVLHLDLCGCVGLHSIDPQLLNSLLKLFFLPSSAFSEGRLHIDMFFEALIHLTFSLFNISFPLCLESSLDFLKFLNALIPQCEILFSHFADKRLDIARLFLQCLGVLIILLLELFPKLIDELILCRNDEFKGFFLFIDCLYGRWLTLESDSHSSYSLSSDHLIYNAVFFLLDATASCWMAINLSWALRSSNILEFFCSCQFLTLRSMMGSFRQWQTLSIPLNEVSICLLPSCIQKLYQQLLRKPSRTLQKHMNNCIEQERFAFANAYVF